jgi:deoxyribonuclease (pyrimidine dimer)
MGIRHCNSSGIPEYVLCCYISILGVVPSRREGTNYIWVDLMTRINIIPTQELADQHLVAEYREMFMVGSSLQRSLKSPNWEKNKKTWPEMFTLNRGHVKFFYNKGMYLHKRYEQLIIEMKSRGMKPDPTRVFKRHQWPDDLYNDWTPTAPEQDIVRERIRERIAIKPTWYRWTSPST